MCGFTESWRKGLLVSGLIAMCYLMSGTHYTMAAAQSTRTSTKEATLLTPISQSTEQGILAVFPLAIGTSWTYHAVIDTSTPENPQHFEGMITETIVSATQYREYWVFRSQITGHPLQPNPASGSFYVVNSKDLYELSNASGAAIAPDLSTMTNYASTQILAWPLEEGQMMGDPAFMNNQGRNVWVVLGTVNIDVPAGHFKNCYRISMFTNPDTMHRWFCPGIGFVRYEYHHYGTRDDEIWQLTSLIFTF